MTKNARTLAAALAMALMVLAMLFYSASTIVTSLEAPAISSTNNTH